MATYIQNLLNNTLGDGARATKFDADIFFTNSSLFPSSEDTRTLVKATAFPGKTHDIVDLKYKGRSIPLKGQVKYNQTWSCTFYLTEDHKLKNAFEVWLEALDQQHNYPKVDDVAGLAGTQGKHVSSYTSNVKLFQKNFNNTINTAQYNLFNVFPIEVSGMEYSSESVGQIQEFTVTFAYSYYTMEVLKGPDGNFIDQFIDKQIQEISNTISSSVGDIGNIASTVINDVFGGLKRAKTSEVETEKQRVRGPSTQKGTVHDSKR
jgi:hypothetical protein